MNKIYVCGLGPGDAEHATAETIDLLSSNNFKIFLRTNKHPSANLAEGAETFDSVYDSHEDFQSVYLEIYNQLKIASRTQSIVYAVPGSPLVLEQTVNHLINDNDLEVQLLPAISFLDVAWARLQVDPVSDGVQLIDGMQFQKQATNSNGPLLIAQTYNKKILSDIKLSCEPNANQKVTVLENLGTTSENIRTIKWYELDKEVEPNHLTSLFVDGLDQSPGSALQKNVELIHLLRQECPWDQEQTHTSLKKHLLEEAEELAEAIDNLDPNNLTTFINLEEELGDLWLQVLLHSEIAKEAGQFDINNVADTLQEKMVRRHPHVFGDSQASTLEELEDQWNRIKQQEKK